MILNARDYDLRAVDIKSPEIENEVAVSLAHNRFSNKLINSRHCALRTTCLISDTPIC